MKILGWQALTYSDSGAGANSSFSGGIRTYTKPGTSDTVQVYVNVEKKVLQLKEAN